MNVAIANVHFQHEDYALAIPYYEAALKIKSNYYMALLEAGLCYMRLAQFDEAIQLFTRAIAIRPERWEGPYDLACVYALDGKVSDSIQALRTMLDAQDRSMQTKLLDAVANDDDLKSLLGLPEFDTLLKDYQPKPQE